MGKSNPNPNRSNLWENQILILIEVGKKYGKIKTNPNSNTNRSNLWENQILILITEMGKK